MATYYVDKDSIGGAASDSNSGTDTGHPFLTIGKGLNSLTAGDTLLIRAGFYDYGISTMPSGTSWNNKVRVAAYPGTGTGTETVWLRPLVPFTNNPGCCVFMYHGESYIEFDGINMDGETGQMPFATYSTHVDTGGAGSEPHHIRLKNCEVKTLYGGSNAPSQFAQWSVNLGGHRVVNAVGGHEIINVTIHGGGQPGGGADNHYNGYGVYVSSPNCLVQGCNIYNTSSAGIHCYNGGGDSPDNCTFVGNTIHDIVHTGNNAQVWGILTYGNNTQIYNNVIYGINVGSVLANNSAIALVGTGCLVAYNTIYNCTNSGIFIDSSVNAGTTTVQNNVVYQTTGATYVDNHSGSATTTQNHNFNIPSGSTDPQWKNAAGADFRPADTSPLINAGIAITTPTTDYIGTARGTPTDIGAYEWIPVVTTATNYGSAGSTDTNSVTTAGLNMTGSTMIIVCVAWYGGGTTPVLSSSPANAWLPLTVSTEPNNNVKCQLYYRPAPAVSATMTFTATGTGSYPAISAMGTTSPAITAMADQQTGTTTSGGTTVAPGSLTPTENSAFLVTGLAANSAVTPAIDSQFVVLTNAPNSATSQSAAIAYYVQPTAAAISPIWTVAGGMSGASRLVSFKTVNYRRRPRKPA